MQALLLFFVWGNSNFIYLWLSDRWQKKTCKRRCLGLREIIKKEIMAFHFPTRHYSSTCAASWPWETLVDSACIILLKHWFLAIVDWVQRADGSKRDMVTVCDHTRGSVLSAAGNFHQWCFRRTVRIAFCCNIMVEQHIFSRGSWWHLHWLYYKSKSPCYQVRDEPGITLSNTTHNMPKATQTKAF